jgi:hypothetical protein
MADLPKKGFSAADPDDEIDLEALVKKAPPPQAAPVRQPSPQSVQPPRQEKPRTPAPQAEEFDVRSFPPAAPAEPKKQPQAAQPLRIEPEDSTDYDHETEFDHPAHRKKVRVLPSLPTLILIIIVSVATAFVTGIIVHLTAPSLDTKMQEILSNQENNSVKVNNLEQTVSRMVDDLKALQSRPQPAPAPAAPKKHAARPKPAPETAPPAPEPAAETPAPAE